MTAALFVVGYDSYQLESFFQEDIYAIMNGEYVVDTGQHFIDSIQSIDMTENIKQI